MSVPSFWRAWRWKELIFVKRTSASGHGRSQNIRGQICLKISIQIVRPSHGEILVTLRTPLPHVVKMAPHSQRMRDDISSSSLSRLTVSTCPLLSASWDVLFPFQSCSIPPSTRTPRSLQTSRLPRLAARWRAVIPLLSRNLGLQRRA